MVKGNIRAWLRGLGPRKRYALYIVPLSLVLAVPLGVALLRDGRSSDGLPGYTVVGMDEKRFWILAESIWTGLWLCRAVAYVLPRIMKYFQGEVKLGSPQYNQLLAEIQRSVSLLLWMALNMVVVTLLVENRVAWKNTAQSILKAFILCSCMILVKQSMLQMLRQSADRRMAEKKPNTNELSSLYAASLQTHCGNDPHDKRTDQNAHEIEKGITPLDKVSIKVRSTLKSMVSTTELAKTVYQGLCESSVSLTNCGLSNDIVELLDRDQVSPACLSDRIRYMFISACAGDVLQAINELDTMLSIVVLLLSIVIFVMFLSPNLLGALATSATALLSLSFVFATTCQEVLGSCVFLFIKHPYDVGDYVIIDATELVVERISLLYTIFTRVQAAQVVQTPNIVLNSLWVDNVTRSKQFKEQTTIHVAFDTDLSVLTTLKARVLELAGSKFSGATLEIASVADTEGLQLLCEVHYHTNRPDGTLRAVRRSCFMHALVKALREAQIRGPGGTAVAAVLEQNPRQGQ